jgi:glutamine phosphoribosylpyrophosphate amidotransferase
VRYPNVYGIDMASNKEFIAHNKNTDEICKAISLIEAITSFATITLYLTRDCGV